MRWKDALSRRGALLGGVAAVALVVSFHAGTASDPNELASLLSIEADGLSIRGVTTWILAALIVWLAALVAALLLPFLGLKRFLEERRT